MLTIMIMTGLAVAIVAIMHALAMRITIREEMRMQEEEMMLQTLLRERHAE